MAGNRKPIDVSPGAGTRTTVWCGAYAFGSDDSFLPQAARLGRKYVDKRPDQRPPEVSFREEFERLRTGAPADGQVLLDQLEHRWRHPDCLPALYLITCTLEAPNRGASTSLPTAPSSWPVGTSTESSISMPPGSVWAPSGRGSATPTRSRSRQTGPSTRSTSAQRSFAASRPTERRPSSAGTEVMSLRRPAVASSARARPRRRTAPFVHRRSPRFRSRQAP